MAEDPMARDAIKPRSRRQSGSDLPGLYVLEEQVGHLLRRAHQRHTAIFQEKIGDKQLTPLQFAALIKLRDVDEVSQNQLGRMTAMDAATMQGVIHRLLARGLIERRKDPADRRRLQLSLSVMGKSIVDECAGAGLEISAETLAPLDPEDRRLFLDMLSRLSF
jgi:MarR family transcriptional regulator, lower aerobic nicotinate degradation pathway regulator